ncbi:unnamed protein product [Caenorhabditis angaria]|uniref:V-type proton ATPase subunit H n=1 Tax=Caenorhabditis angaria TaxID=860376 RepID=A0A9P1IG22_9PELO|nr:unnamed protein product [Caenorhabditis angaria]
MVYGDDQELVRSHLQIETAKVRQLKMNWLPFLKARMISHHDYDFIVTYEDAVNKHERNVVLNVYKDKAVYAFIHLASQVTKNEFVRYVLTVIDDLLIEDGTRVEIFEVAANLSKRSPFFFFVNFLTRSDPYTVHITCEIVTKLATLGKTKMSGDDLEYFMGFFREQMNRGLANDYISSTTRCMQTLFRCDSYRVAFANHNGHDSLIHALYSTRKCGFQIQYQIIFCMWLLTFNHYAAEQTLNSNVIQMIVTILGTCSKEKVIRIILATLRNILSKIEDKVHKKQAALQMVQCKLIKKLELIDTRKFDDIELLEDIAFLRENLQKITVDLTSFDEYESELRHGCLHWSPVHKCEKFWEKNASKLNENRNELLKILIGLLENSNDPLVVCVAAHDIGEYVRFNPRGKHFLEQLGGKEALMRLLMVKDPNIRYHALLSAQKFMVHNWKYLGLKYT